MSQCSRLTNTTNMQALPIVPQQAKLLPLHSIIFVLCMFISFIPSLPPLIIGASPYLIVIRHCRTSSSHLIVMSHRHISLSLGKLLGITLIRSPSPFILPTFPPAHPFSPFLPHLRPLFYSDPTS